jgi:mannose-6-phosphate isomerase
MEPSTLYPLQFRPLFRDYLWGGRRLETLLGKRLPAGGHFAESWEVVDHGEDQSVVENGPLAGTALHELASRYAPQLFGRHASPDRFPLLFKFLDARKTLSVQVHPNDDQAARLDPPDLGKTEAWVVLAAEPGSKIYAGLKRGFDRQALEREVSRGTCELCLHSFEPRPGDCVFLPAGTVHALGAGLVVAEIQQASDTTYRLFDWHRVDPRTGRPRELHVQEALDVIDYGRGPVDAVTPRPTERPHIERLVESDKFVLERQTIDGPSLVGGQDRFHLLAVVGGCIFIEEAHVANPLHTGQTLLVPAACGFIRARGQQATVLDIYLPQ